MSRGHPQVQAQIGRYRPRDASAPVGAFAREVVAAAAPKSPERAKALLFAAGRLASFAESVGLPLDRKALLCPANIERFILAGCPELSPATRRTLRSNLCALACALFPDPEPRALALPRERAKAPYSNIQIAGYLRLAACQSTLARQMHCCALICLGAGAGVVGAELRHIRGCDVAERSGGVIVSVSGKRARAVPALERFSEPLLASAHFAGEHFIIGGQEATRRNICDSLFAQLSADPSLGRLESGRLRSTWLCAVAQAIGLGAFMAAAGVSCSQRLGDIAATLPALSEAEQIRLLGGQA